MTASFLHTIHILEHREYLHERASVFLLRIFMKWAEILEYVNVTVHVCWQVIVTEKTIHNFRHGSWLNHGTTMAWHLMWILAIARTDWCHLLGGTGYSSRGHACSWGPGIRSLVTYVTVRSVGGQKVSKRSQQVRMLKYDHSNAWSE